ncbi:TIGR03088 family PEP-CTERM/XrtA system glycosyltransferase [Arsukibacterium sp.]|uniref:TIGR03088 family PEP-CTERM/XrtA system glycosyltransferase n=1 Tax=Arsukibacterium sp. TaxID=1977258 RepID=UPI002FDB5D36
MTVQPATSVAIGGQTAIKPIHICHIIWSFRTGGLENGVVNLINQLDETQFRHSILCLTDFDERFFQRIKLTNVEIYRLNKRSGHDLQSFWNAFKLLRQLKPDICHSRNIAALEYQFSAWLARVPYRVHGEHGWDIKDLAGVNKKYIWLKRFFKPFIHQYISLSKESLRYLKQQIKVPEHKLNLICNGVDTEKFSPHNSLPSALPAPLLDSKRTIFASVGRMVPVKNHPLLVKAYIELCQQDIHFKANSALVIIGEGEFRADMIRQLAQAGLTSQCWLPGNRDDIASILPACSVFVLPSLAEGISNTILEAMASGLPVIACRVGGNPDLIRDNENGWLIANNDLSALKQQLMQCFLQPGQRQLAAEQARLAAVQQFSMQNMVKRYQVLYQQNLSAITHTAKEA